jgi:nucleotide-binding universal stress UspA family protein
MEAYAIKSILVPIDFSDVATNALKTAVAIATRQLTTVTLIHVVENTYHLVPAEAGPAMGGTLGTILPELLRVAHENLNALAREVRTNHDLVVDHVVQTGNPADEICRWAHQKSNDVIVMGTHGASGIREFFMGSNAYRVVKNAPCPVMTIPGTNTWLDFKKILFPIRMIPNALDKYDVIRPIIRKNGSSLLVMGVVKKNEESEMPEMKELVDTIQKKMVDDQVICRREIVSAEDIARQVLVVSRAEKPDLIVITATLDASLKDFFLGPYTQDIVNHAKFPVLSIRPRLSVNAPVEEATVEAHR